MATLDDPADRAFRNEGADPEHELLTPLTAIRALAEILRDHPDLPREQRLLFVERMLSEQARLERRIEAWLALRR